MSAKRHLPGDGAGADQVEPLLKRSRSNYSGYAGCQVNGCMTTNSSGTVSFKKFPAKTASAEPWVQFCGNRDLLSVPLQKLRNRTVCSNHFEEGNVGGRGRRKPGVQPTLNPPVQKLTNAEMSIWNSIVGSEGQRQPNTSDCLPLMDVVSDEAIRCENSGSANQVCELGADMFLEDLLSRSPHNSINEANSDDSLPLTPGTEIVPDLFVQGTFHQGDATRFIGSHGQQCSAIAAYAVAMASIAAFDKWNTEVMDIIVTEGDKFFKQKFSNGNYRHLPPDEVLPSYKIAQKEIKFSFCIAATPVKEGHNFSSHPEENLALILKNELVLENATEADFVALLMVSYEETTAIWRDKKEPSKYWLFDSHARDQNGKVNGDGKSFCGRFLSMEDLVQTHYANHRDENGNIKEGYFQITQVKVTVINKSASVALPNEDGERPGIVQDTPVVPKPSRKRNKRGKQRRQNNRWSRRIKSVLDSIEVAVSENQTPAERVLADRCEMLWRFSKDILSKYDAAMKTVHRLRKLSIREFLFDRGVSEYTIGTAECEARNNGRDCHGWRHTESCKAHSVSLQKAGGLRTLDVARQWSTALPSRSTNARCLKKIHIDIGLFQESSLMCHIGRLLTSALDEMFKLVVVAFDETKVQRCLTPKPEEGYILGFQDFGGGDRHPTFADQCLVFLVQGLVMNWNFPGAVMFATTATKGVILTELLPKFIRYLRSLGAKPVLTVCDQSTHNATAVKSLMGQHPVIIDGETQKSQFEVDGEPVVSIYDPAHHIKCLRNAVLGGEGKKAVYGSVSWPVSTDEGEEIFYELKWTMFRELLGYVPNGLLCRKLTDEHLSAKRRMKVKFATELFSATNAALFESVGDVRLPGASLAAKVVGDLDRFFDLNLGHSSTESADTLKEARKPMSTTSIHMEAFPGYLQKMQTAKFYCYKDKGEGRLQRTSSSCHVRTNWTHTIHGLMALPEIVRKYNVSEFNVRSVGQCTLESNFSRYKEGRRYPTPQQILEGIKTTCVRGIVKPRSTGTNCEVSWSTREDTLMDFMRPVNVGGVSECQIPAVPVQLRFDVNDIYPVLSIPDENSVPAVEEAEENSPLQETLLLILASNIIKHLRRRSGACESCRSVLCSNPAGDVNSLAQWMSLQLLSHLPSDNFLTFVKECRKEFKHSWHKRLHELGIYTKIKFGLTAETNSSWFLCEEHADNLYTSLTEVLVADRVKLLNAEIRPKSRPHNRDPTVLGQMMAGAGITEDVLDEMEAEETGLS